MGFTTSIIGWYGGKYNLLKYILPFPVHTTYVEVFAGSLVILKNKEPSLVEVANDFNSRLVNMYRQIKLNHRRFVDLAINEYGIDSRELFEDCIQNEAKDKIEDAVRMYYINHHSFSQMNTAYHGMSFTGRENSHHPYLSHLKRIDDFHDRFKYVQFENQDFRKIIKRSDRKETLLMLDPPYFKGGELYENMAGNEKLTWTMKDFEDLRELLYGLKNAMFVLTVDSKDFFSNDKWFFQEVERTNMAALKIDGAERSKDIEYVIRNFDPKKTETMVGQSRKDKIKDDMEL